jgi:serine/threonine protein kinase
MQRINEKSDVYSFGVVLLEILTGRHPLDPTVPGGAHLVQWVREQQQQAKPRGGGHDELLIDARLRGSAGEADAHEMRQVLAVAVLCVSHRADDRPAMKDVVALLEEIRRPAAADDAKPPPAAALPAAFAAPMLSPARGGAHSRGDSFAVSDYSA